MASDKLARGYRYYVKFSGGTNEPVNGTIKLLRRPPKDGAIWRDVTSCLKVCCDTGTLTADDFTLTMNTETQTGDGVLSSNATSSAGDTITMVTYTGTLGGVDIDIAADGTIDLAIDNPAADLTATIVMPVTFQDQHSNSVTVNMTIEVSYTAA